MEEINGWKLDQPYQKSKLMMSMSSLTLTLSNEKLKVL